MLCKDCIHFDVCKDATVPNPEYKGAQPDKSKECRHFKNKTDYTEVKHGHWIQEWELEKGFEDNDEIPYIKCSLCGYTEWGIDKERDATPNYCSDCGAKMDGGS